MERVEGSEENGCEAGKDVSILLDSMVDCSFALAFLSLSLVLVVLPT
jgi:hypothetical protein